jgi:hypothetical protein
VDYDGYVWNYVLGVAVAVLGFPHAAVTHVHQSRSLA